MDRQYPADNPTPKGKSLFVSTTFWGAILTLIVAVTPAIGDIVTEYQKSGAIETSRITEIIMLLAGTGLTIIGRANASQPVYTPSYLPGPNKEDVA